MHTADADFAVACGIVSFCLIGHSLRNFRVSRLVDDIENLRIHFFVAENMLHVS